MNLGGRDKTHEFLNFKYGLDYDSDAIITSPYKSSDGLFNFSEVLGICLVQGFIANLFFGWAAIKPSTSLKTASINNKEKGNVNDSNRNLHGHYR